MILGTQQGEGGRGVWGIEGNRGHYKGSVDAGGWGGYRGNSRRWGDYKGVRGATAATCCTVR